MDRTDGARLSERAHQWAPIVVHLPDMDGEYGPFIRYAVAVIESPNGIGWVEPSYIGEIPGPPAYHGFRGTSVWRDDRLVLDRGDGRSVVVRPPERDDGNEVDNVQRAWRAWTTWVEGQGRSEGQERQRLLDELNPLPLSN